MLSRTASNLYWMSRYVERAENSARILDVAYRMSLLTKDPSLQDQEWFAPLNITGTLFPFSGRHDVVNARQVLHFMALDPDNPASIYNCALQARENARAVRGSITSEMWEVINATWLEMKNMDEDRLHARGISNFFDWVKERSHLFRGVTFGTIRRDEAFHFHRLGTYVERADNTARILDVKYHVLLPSVADVGGAVDYYQWSAVLRSVSAFEAYRKVYRDVITPLRIAELLILREDLPRSLHFCLRDVYQILNLVRNSQSGEATRQAGEIYSQLQFGRISDIFAQGLHEYLTNFLHATGRLGEEINKSFFAPTLR
ncbi:MAG: alpha-E domain-containing protein [Betaproteobacteria bacterium]|nr:alpha-E domain-containing protein [Betaproteobacteria bacterium]